MSRVSFGPAVRSRLIEANICFLDQNLALTQKMEQEKSDLTTHLSTIAIREAEILNLRTELARVSSRGSVGPARSN